MLTPSQSPRSPLVAMSTKTYFGVAHTLDWLRALAHHPVLAHSETVDVAVFPSFPVLGQIADLLGPSDVAWGAQDVAPTGGGSQTGEVTAGMLRECGCAYVEIGHAERRLSFGETPGVIRQKITECVAHGLVPLLCVGEPEEMESGAAAQYCGEQVRGALEGQLLGDVVIAYEPVWAIGAAEPAPAEHVRIVCRGLKSALAEMKIPGRVIYGGTAGPGLAAHLMPDADGLFLGRRAHELESFAQVVQEVAEATASRN